MKLTKIIILLVCLIPAISWGKKPDLLDQVPDIAKEKAQGVPFTGGPNGTIPEPEILSLFLAAGIAAFAMKSAKKTK